MRPTPPAAAWRLLHLEDSALDHELMLAHLRRGGLAVEAQRVESAIQFRAVLGRKRDVSWLRGDAVLNFFHEQTTFGGGEGAKFGFDGGGHGSFVGSILERFFVVSSGGCWVATRVADRVFATWTRWECGVTIRQKARLVWV